LIEELKKKLDFPLLECKFTNRDNLLFLDIEIDYPTMGEIQAKSRIISDIIDEIDTSDKEYYLNIYSSGAEKDIVLSELKNYLEKFIQIYLEKQQHDNI
jgi:ribosome maturation factor RimP